MIIEIHSLGILINNRSFAEITFFELNF